VLRWSRCSQGLRIARFIGTTRPNQDPAPAPGPWPWLPSAPHSTTQHH
jgi:hypothetical protein